MTRKQVVILALPAVAEMAVHTFVSAIVVGIIGRLGAYAITTVGISGQIIINAAFVLSAMGVGASVLVARAIGKKDITEANHFFAKGLGLGFIIAIIWSIFFRLTIPYILDFLTLDDTLRSILIEYMRIVSLPSGILIALFILEFMVRGAGHTAVTLFVAIFSGVVNVIASYVLIYGKLGFAAYGIFGAAYGAVISYITAAIVMLLIVASNKLNVQILWRKVFEFDKKAYRRILNTGVPAALDEGMWTLNQWVLLGILPALGATQYASHQIALSTEGISFMPGYGFAIAAQILVGQKLGAGLPQEAKKVTTQALQIALGTMILVSTAFFFFGNNLVSLFTNKIELIPLATACIRIAAFEQPMIAIYMVFTGAFRGAGDTRFPLLLSIFAYWIIRVPLIYLAINVFHYGITAFWYVTVFQWTITAILCYIRFKSNKWLAVEV